MLNIYSFLSKQSQLQFNMIEPPIVEDVIGKNLAQKNEFSMPSIDPSTQRYFYEKQTLYEPKKRRSVESVKRRPKHLRVKPIFWSKSKLPLISQHKFDTKGIGLVIKPPPSFVNTKVMSMSQRGYIVPQKPKLLEKIRRSRQSAPKIISTHRDPFISENRKLDFNSYDPCVEEYYRKTVLKRLEVSKDRDKVNHI
jgi:hypothetical protein